MEIERVDSDNPAQLRRFLQLPFRLYQRSAQWVPPLAAEARGVLDRRHHPFYRHSEAEFFLAVDRGRDVGRLAVLEHRNYNRHHNERTAFFTLFESEPRREAAETLFEAASAWARRRGLNRMLGPKGFSAFDGMGVLVRGSEYRPAMGIPYNPPYYASLLEAVGFEPAGEVVSGYLHRSTPFPERIHRLSELAQRRRCLRVARYRTRRDLRALVPLLGALYNQAIEDMPGSVPATEEEVEAIARQMLAFADPRLIKVVLKGDEPVGFLFAYPDISAALQRTRGRLFPFGWLDLLLELRRTRWININGAAIAQPYRGLGGTAILFSEMQRSVVEGRFEHAEIVQIGVENEAMQREMRSLGIDFYKTHRLYYKDL